MALRALQWLALQEGFSKTGSVRSLRPGVTRRSLLPGEGVFRAPFRGNYFYLTTDAEKDEIPMISEGVEVESG